MDDRRKYQRSHLIHYLRIFNPEGEQLGNLVDITPAGVMFISEKPIDKAFSRVYHMEFPEEVHGKLNLQFSATCVWSRVDVNDPDLYANGLQFDTVLPEDIETIQYLIDEYRDTEEEL
jgi:hypothetical protein